MYFPPHAIFICFPRLLPSDSTHWYIASGFLSIKNGKKIPFDNPKRGACCCSAVDLILNVMCLYCRMTLTSRWLAADIFLWKCVTEGIDGIGLRSAVMKYQCKCGMWSNSGIEELMKFVLWRNRRNAWYSATICQIPLRLHSVSFIISLAWIGCIMDAGRVCSKLACTVILDWWGIDAIMDKYRKKLIYCQTWTHACSFWNTLHLSVLMKGCKDEGYGWKSYLLFCCWCLSGLLARFVAKIRFHSCIPR